MSKKNHHPDDGPGIYKITCLADGKHYIGQAFHVVDRLKTHCKKIQDGTHPNRHVRSARALYGPDCWEYEICKRCEISELNVEEVAAIAAFGRENLFNFTDGGEGLKGFKQSAESIEKVSETKLKAWESGKYDRQETEIWRVNVFTGTRTKYIRSGSAEKDGFSRDTIMSCICGLKRTHKGFFWVRHDDPRTYEELLASLPKLSLQQAKAWRSFALLLDGFEVTDEPQLKSVSERLGGRPKKPIQRTDLITGAIKTYASIRAAVCDGFDRSTIQRTLRGHLKTYRGFTWAELKEPTQESTPKAKPEATAEIQIALFSAAYQ